jgi:tripartite-type tricarboxylate transporter receptor subunit TctC
MKEAAKMRNSPEFQAAMKKMQKSPEFKEAMKQANAMSADPNTLAKMQAKVEHMVNVGQSELKKKAKDDMAEAMDALYSNPEVMEEAKKLVSDPNFASYIKEMATDPAFKNYIGAVRMYLFFNILMNNFVSIY